MFIYREGDIMIIIITITIMFIIMQPGRTAGPRRAA